MNETLKAEIEMSFEMKSSEDRREIFEWMRGRWCDHCGDVQPEDIRGCQCWNDE